MKIVGHIACVCLLGLNLAPMGAAEIDFVEKFALSDDRAKTLTDLVPGTDEFYYYSCLQAQNTQRFSDVEPLLKTWILRHRETARATEIIHRQALLTYTDKPQETLQFIRTRLNLRFDHQARNVDRAADLPSVLDPKLIADDTLFARALAEKRNTGRFEATAISELIRHGKLTDQQRHHLLSRLRRPDYDGLVDLMLLDLKKHGFGTHPVHNLLLLDQLDQMLVARPTLINIGGFVGTYLANLQPGPESDWQHGVQSRVEHFTRLWQFARRLPAAQNSLKAHVLHHLLAAQQRAGEYDQKLFLTYLKFPRQSPVISAKFLASSKKNKEYVAILSDDHSPLTQMPAIGTDEPLIRAHLQSTFVEADNYDAFVAYLDETYLKQIFAETKILRGLGDTERWSAWLSPTQFKELRERTDIQFADSSRQRFSGDEPVSLDVEIKNVKSLIVKIYEINALNYYLSEGTEIDTGLNLDGLKANVERRFDYAEPSFRRVSRHFEFPELEQPGVYIVDFIGNGKSSRALVRKGGLIATSRPTAAGQAISVFDENRKPVPTASVFLGGREFTANTLGEVLLPYSTSPSQKMIVLHHDGLASRHELMHRGEAYELTAGFYVDRESLVRREKTRLVIRPQLRINGATMSMDAMNQVVLTITSTNLEGISSTQTVEDFKLEDDHDSIHEFYTPLHARRIEVTLTGKVRKLTDGDEQVVATSTTFELNALRETKRLLTCQLTKSEELYAIDLLGLTGEAYPGLPLHVTCKHRDYVQPVETTLKTAANGRIILGVLDKLTFVQVRLPDGSTRRWHLDDAKYRFPKTIHQLAGTPIVLPYLGTSQQIARDEFSLLEIRSGHSVADHFPRMKLNRGRLEIAKLPVGDYELRLPREAATIIIRMTEGKRHRGALVGERRILDAGHPAPMFIAATKIDADSVRIQLENYDKATRLHAFVTRFQPDYSLFDRLGRLPIREPGWAKPAPRLTRYVEERDLGDELQYIIDRQYADKFPGVFLAPPSLLINPWAVRSTQTGTQAAAAGAEFGTVMDADSESSEATSREKANGATTRQTDYLEFLPQGSVALLDIAVDDQGIATIPKASLNGLHMIHLVAVDETWTDYRSITLEESAWSPIDLRLRKTFDVDQHIAKQQRIKTLPAGDRMTLAESSTSQLAVYSRLDKVYSLYKTLLPGSQLGDFEFLVGWNQLENAQKTELYGKYACHELHLFLSRRDPEFFDQRVKPLISDKKEKQFMDHFLLGDDLSQYLQPWRYQRLNVLERVLLAERNGQHRDSTIVHLSDLVRQNPVSRDDTSMRIRTALGMQEMEKLSELSGPAKMGVIALQRSAAEPNLAGILADGLTLSNGSRSRLARPSDSKNLAELQDLNESIVAEKLAKKNFSRAIGASGMRQMAGNRDGFSEDPLGLKFYEGARHKSGYVLFRQTGRTQEWAESQYYRVELLSENGALVTSNRFWQDYVSRPKKGPFLSGHFTDASRTFTEAIAALALLDLNLDGDEVEPIYENGQVIIVASSPTIVVYEESAYGKVRDDVPILTSQRFYDDAPEHAQRNANHDHIYVNDEFLRGTQYGCQIVVTNPSAQMRSLNVITQVPQGSISLGDSRTSRSIPVDVEPFQTQIVHYAFYFPLKGDFDHYPVHVSVEEEIVAFTEPDTFVVLDEPTKFDTKSWSYISQRGTDRDVLDFIAEQPLENANLDDIAFRLRDRDFYKRVINALDLRRVYQRTVWSYAVLHDDADQINTFLQHEDGFVQSCGPVLDSPVLTIDPLARGTYQHYEYRPLINARTHQLGQTRQILNDRLNQQYHRLMLQLAHQREMNATDRLAVVYYLTTQGRTDESLAHFAKINPESLEARIQYEYMAAYLDFFADEPQKAIAIAEKYADYPVQHWQEAFAAISAQIAELNGAAATIIDDKARNQQQTVQADAEPTLEVQQQGKVVQLVANNVAEVTVSYYVMDIEVLFSRNPFVKQDAGKISFVRPTAEQAVTVADEGPTIIELPEKLREENVLVEVRGNGKSASTMVLANNLRVDLSGNYGQLRVRHAENQKPLHTTYVKVYARHNNGTVHFYKDGYTDLRGRFDYASLSTNQLDEVQKFSVLVMNDDHGAVIQEFDPPAR